MGATTTVRCKCSTCGACLSYHLARLGPEVRDEVESRVALLNGERRRTEPLCVLVEEATRHVTPIPSSR